MLLFEKKLLTTICGGPPCVHGTMYYDRRSSAATVLNREQQFSFPLPPATIFSLDLETGKKIAVNRPCCVHVALLQYYILRQKKKLQPVGLRYHRQRYPSLFKTRPRQDDDRRWCLGPTATDKIAHAKRLESLENFCSVCAYNIIHIIHRGSRVLYDHCDRVLIERVTGLSHKIIPTARSSGSLNFLDTSHWYVK